MLNVEQVRLLEERVQRVISRTSELQRENGDLRERLEGYQDRIRELETHIESFVASQAEIEQGVLNALHRLDEVEDAVVEGVQEDRVVPPGNGGVEADSAAENDSEAERIAETTDETAVSVDSEPEQLPVDEGETDPDLSEADTNTAETDDTDDSQGDEESSGPELDIF